jgi:hypothetical protein
VVQNSTHNPKIEGLKPGREKMPGKDCHLLDGALLGLAHDIGVAHGVELGQLVHGQPVDSIKNFIINVYVTLEE